MSLSTHNAWLASDDPNFCPDSVDGAHSPRKSENAGNDKTIYVYCHFCGREGTAEITWEPA